MQNNEHTPEIDRMARRLKEAFVREAASLGARLENPFKDGVCGVPAANVRLTPRVEDRFSSEEGNGEIEMEEEDKAKADKWRAFARFVFAEDLDPDAYVASQFLMTARMPTLRTMAGDAGLTQYRNYLALEAGSIAVRLRTQSAKVATEMRSSGVTGTSSEILAKVLRILRRELDPLFVFSLAVATFRDQGGKDLEDLASDFEDAARRQYLVHREAFDKHWMAILPANVVAKWRMERSEA